MREKIFHTEMESVHKMATVISLTDLTLKIDASQNFSKMQNLKNISQ
jgi:hypothetical protein